MSTRRPRVVARLSTVLAERAAQYRAAPTLTEALLWEELRASKLGVGFRRQFPIERFIADFACPARRLVVEVDGGYHREAAAQRADARRDRVLARLGWQVVRVMAEEVQRDMPAVVARIRAALGAQ